MCHVQAQGHTTCQTLLVQLALPSPWRQGSGLTLTQATCLALVNMMWQLLATLVQHSPWLDVAPGRQHRSRTPHQGQVRHRHGFVALRLQH